MSLNAPSLAGISPFNWRDAPRQTTNNRNPQRTELHVGLVDPYHSRCITVVGRAKGAANAAKNDSIKRGGI
ncbi:hypothetical protein [Variovorax sp. PAMC 28711]|uniref:hypothetical protein n=1 Tax=Variovorax sp. PAMC 28711 TaxID=1795631 RepID=UPI00078C1D24|nr:hypothetical protein [Variovorax sp. PAMC 28711]AMM23192.1 hypothetical protein AX767_01475 [Variovorax sp. PAMC 28711]